MFCLNFLVLVTTLVYGVEKKCIVIIILTLFNFNCLYLEQIDINLRIFGIVKYIVNRQNYVLSAIV